MKITFYGSALCPRCRAARRHLQHLQAKYPEMDITVKDIFSHPQELIANKIWMIPALRCMDAKLTGFLLSEEKIDTFLASCSGEKI